MKKILIGVYILFCCQLGIGQEEQYLNTLKEERILPSSTLIANDDFCGAAISLEMRKKMATNLAKEQGEAAERVKSNSNLIFPLKFVVSANDNGSNPVVSPQDIYNSLQEINNLFSGSGVSFAVYNKIDKYHSSSWRNSSVTALNMLGFVYDAPGPYHDVITVYVVNGGFGFGTYPSLAPTHPYIVITASGITTTRGYFAHELGHVFNLYHTHCNLTEAPIPCDPEFVLRPGDTNYWLYGNCGGNTVGDGLCETPADPHLQTGVLVHSGSCDYKFAPGDPGQPTDFWGFEYTNVDTRNIMAYTWRKCQLHFVDAQKQVIQNIANSWAGRYGIAVNIPCEHNKTIEIDYPIPKGTTMFRLSGINSRLVFHHTPASSATFLLSVAGAIVLKPGASLRANALKHIYTSGCTSTLVSNDEIEMTNDTPSFDPVIMHQADKEAPFSVMPNPSNAQFQFEYRVEVAQTPVFIGIYDSFGKLLKIMVNQSQHRTGNYACTWEADENLAVGIYIMRGLIGKKIFSEKLVLLR